MIVKQSSLKVAAEFCIHKKKEKATLTDIFKTANTITEWVLKPYTPDDAGEWLKLPVKETKVLN